jgi:Lon-like protease
VAALLPVPYVLRSPGLAVNTLGAVDGRDLIVIHGRRTYPTAGHLDLTSIRVAGGPGRRLGLAQALRGWLDPTVAVVPEEQFYPPGVTPRDVRRRDEAAMAESQDNATAAALRALKIPVDEVVTVARVLDDSPAHGILEPGDVIVAVDETPVHTSADARAVISRRDPGERVRLTVRRDGRERHLTVRTAPASDGSGRAAVGVLLDPSFRFPFTVRISLADVGGPSAGMMFALGIFDKLTPGELNGGSYVAGTGTIDAAGHVGPIGGIQQKLVAADDAGARLFLAPEANCADVAAATPPGLRVTKVADLDDALAALAALRAHRVGSLPSCEP